MSLADRLTALLAAPDASIHAVGAWLDGLDHAGRLEAMSQTSRAQQLKLYELAAASAPLSLADFVPPSVPDRTEVIHHGRNSLPAFRSFQKRFARADAARCFGYNEGATRRLIGPGYFVAHDTVGNPEWEARGAVVVDYFMVPDGPVPDGWPTVVPNSRGPQILVYHRTRDFMRRISGHVTIGKAFKGEKSMESFFTLVREDRA
jgi:hypothetical protein